MTIIRNILIFACLALFVNCTGYSYVSSNGSKGERANAQHRYFDIINNDFSASKSALQNALMSIGYLEINRENNDRPVYFEISNDTLTLNAAILPRPFKDKVSLVLYQVKDNTKTMSKESFDRMAEFEFQKVEEIYY